MCHPNNKQANKTRNIAFDSTPLQVEVQINNIIVAPHAE